MADTDQSITNLRYNQVTQGMEGFGGGSPMWTPLVLTADGGINQLTGDVTAGPGVGSQVATIASSLTGKTFTSTVTINPTTNQLILGGIGGAKTVTISAPTPASSSRVYTIPDTSALSADFVLSEGAQFINGVITLPSITALLGYIVLGSSSPALTEIAIATTTGPRVMTIPETGADANFVMSQGAQTISGTLTFSKDPVFNVSSLATTGTVTPDGTLGPTYTIVLTDNVSLNGPSSPVDGQKVTFRFTNDSSHVVTLATGAGNFAFGATVPSYTGTASKTDYVGAIYNATSNRWEVVSASLGF